MLAGSHQGRDTDWVRERHNTQSSSYSRCHDRQTATQGLVSQRLKWWKDGENGWLRRGEASGKCSKGAMRTEGTVILGYHFLKHWRDKLPRLCQKRSYISCLLLKTHFNSVCQLLGLIFFSHLVAISFSCHTPHLCRICFSSKHHVRDRTTVASVPLYV